MPRTARASIGGMCYHVLNRGNARAEVFHKETDYRAFVEMMAEAHARVPMRLLGYSLMPNHFHLALWPHTDGDLGRWMHWLMSCHVVRYRYHYGDRGSGHVWQGRFKAFPVEDDAHLLAVLRYIERNPVRGGLVWHAERWRWSSLAVRLASRYPGLLADWPVSRPDNWLDLVNEAESEYDLTNLRRCANRGTPYGSDAWVAHTADALGLRFTLRPRGRPKAR
jgi:putative transposase